MPSKSIFASSTFWLNVASFACAVIQWATSQAWLPATDQVALLAVLNTLNRLRTVGPVHVLPRPS